MFKYDVNYMEQIMTKEQLAKDYYQRWKGDYVAKAAAESGFIAGWQAHQKILPQPQFYVVGTAELDCDCEPHTYYEWEKKDNKCCICNKKII